MKPTELVYSSHDRCEHIHRDWIVQRALESWDNKTLLYLPMSSGSRGDQEYSWGTFSGYLDRFRQWGLEPRTFYWEETLSRGDAQLFFDWLRHSEVVILGGGATGTGMERYQDMGERAFGNAGAFLDTLRARHGEGRLTVGFSAGAVQLCEHSCDSYPHVFGMIRKVITALHYEDATAEHIQHLASTYPDCMVFGLPNDSGIAVNEGLTARGDLWQFIQFITDESWDKPEDGWHIKTRQGVRIEHRYADGRNWRMNGGDVMLRFLYGDGGQRAFIKRPDVPVFHDWGTQQETHYHCLDDIFHDPSVVG